MLETLQLPSTYKLRADVQETDEGFPGTKYGGILDFDEAFEHYIDHTELEKYSAEVSIHFGLTT